MQSGSSSANEEPLLTISEPLKFEIYRANFEPFAITQLLDLGRVKEARELPVEIGTVSGAGRRATLIAVIDHGMITELRVKDCVGCDPSSKGLSDKDTELVVAAIRENESRIPGGIPSLPIPITAQGGSGPGMSAIPSIRIPIGPIIIVVESDWCIGVVIPGVAVCFCCPDLGCRCI